MAPMLGYLSSASNSLLLWHQFLSGACVTPIYKERYSKDVGLAMLTIAFPLLCFFYRNRACISQYHESIYGCFIYSTSKSEYK